MMVTDNYVEPKRRWQVHLTWPVLLVFGWALYEATAQPGLAAAITCAKFGWADFQAARWLRRVDPDRGRGRACFWFYLAFGLWKIAVLAILMMFGLLIVGSLIHGAGRPARRAGVSPVLGGILIAGAIGFGLSFLATYVALWSAIRNRVKIWLGSAPYRARTERYWPPRQGQTNAAPLVIATTFILTLLAFSLSLIILLALAGRGRLAFSTVLPLGSFLMVAGLWLGFHLLDHRIFARAPHECWVTTEGEVAFESADGEPVP